MGQEYSTQLGAVNKIVNKNIKASTASKYLHYFYSRIRIQLVLGWYFLDFQITEVTHITSIKY